MRGFATTLGREPNSAASLVAEFLLRLPDSGGTSHHDFQMFHAAARASYGVPSNAPSILLPLLEKLENERYLTLLKMLEVDQYSDKKRPNAYVDAFLLWTAELAGCTHFLTIERSLVDRHKHESLVAVLPSQLLAELR